MMSLIGMINVVMELFGGLLCLSLALCLVVSKHRKARLDKLYIRLLICNMLLLFSDAAAWFFKGKNGAFFYFGVRAANFCVYVLGYVLLALFTDYLVCYVSQKNERFTKTPARIMWVLSIVGTVLVVVSQFNHMYYFIDERNIYHRQSWFWLSQMFGVACMILCAVILFKSRGSLSRRERVPIGLCVALPVAAMLIQIAVYGVALLYMATTISALGIYLGIQVEQARTYSEKELELERNRVSIMLSQIQPHFIFNALEAIGELCHSDPVQAEAAVTDFPLFLRGNLGALSDTELIPFQQELAHTLHYLKLEQVRFGSRLQVNCDTPVTGFCMPPLTLQPIVENAVRHGVTKRREGGTVTIQTSEGAATFNIMVSDDGVGFDPALPADGKPHIGIANVRTRLAAQCGGTLDLISAPGRGAVALFTLPKARVLPEDEPVQSASV